MRVLRISPDGRYLLISGFEQQIETVDMGGVPTDMVIDYLGGHTLVVDVDSGETVYEDDGLYYGALWSRDSRYIIYPSDAFPEGDNVDAIGYSYLPIFGDEAFKVETGITQEYGYVRWIDDENMLIYYDRTNEFAVLNLLTGAVIPAEEFYSQ